MEQQFSLSWREFQGNLSSGCARLLGSGEFADVTLAAEGKLLQAHRLVLSICSPYFQKMFHANPCQHPIVVLKDISYDALKDLLQFMYNGEVSVKQEDLTNFISTAESLEIKGLTNNLNQEENTINEPRQCSNKSEKIYNNSVEKNDKYCDNNVDDNAKSSNNIHSQQLELLNQINNLASLKRKTESYLTSNKYFSNNDGMGIGAAEKRPKLREKQILNRHKISINHIREPPNKEISTPSFIATNEICKKIIINNAHNEETQRATNSQKNNGKIDDVIEVKKEFEDIESDGTFDESSLRNPDMINDENDSHLDDIQLPPSPLLLPGVSADSFVHYITGPRGHRQLVHMNCVHTRYSKYKQQVNWRCVDYYSDAKCRVRVVTVNDEIFDRHNEHNHPEHRERLARATL